MIFDTHMHCNFSCDSHMKYQEAIEAANRQNMGVVITEHWDYDYPTNPGAFVFKLEDYFAQISALRSENVLFGLEIGMQKHIAAEDDKTAAAYSFDYVLGSLHCVNRRDLYEKACYRGRTKKQIVREFLREAVSCIENHQNFDAFAHIDYMCRYWVYKDKEARLDDAPQAFDEFFKVLVKKGKPMEINTRRLDDAEAVAALTDIYKRYYEMGGRYCTLGSDAHYAEHIGRRLDVALKIAQEAKLQPVYFKERKMQIMGDF